MAQNCPLHGKEMEVIAQYGVSEYDRCPICGLVYIVYGTTMYNAPLPISTDGGKRVVNINVNSEGKLEVTYEE